MAGVLAIEEKRLAIDVIARPGADQEHDGRSPACRCSCLDAWLSNCRRHWNERDASQNVAQRNPPYERWRNTRGKSLICMCTSVRRGGGSDERRSLEILVDPALLHLGGRATRRPTRRSPLVCSARPDGHRAKSPMKLETFDDVVASIAKNPKRPFHLLLGNGFSIAYDSAIFSYSALYDFIEKLDDQDLSKVLGVIETKNFEILMQYLDQFSALIDVFGGSTDVKERVDAAGSKLRTSLLNAVKTMHPEHVFKISEQQREACAHFLMAFLNTGGKVYSTNYDLLLYWVLMRSSIDGHIDGCGRELLNPDEVEKGEEQDWSELLWGKNREDQNVFYVHGALQFFDNGISVIKEEYDAYNYLLQKITARMDKGQYPIFVTAGNGRQKLAHIMHNQYLTHCFNSLCEADGSLVTFGFNFGAQDEHIIDAINKAARRNPSDKLWSVYIGVYSQDDQKHIAQIADKFRCKVRIYDAKTVKPWG